MIAVDSSVVIAGFASWHEHHAVALKALARRPRLVAHAALEAYSVLTRLPPPHRAQPDIVHEFIAQRFQKPFLVLSESGYRKLLAKAASDPILGGQTYDAMIALTALEHDASLVSLDKRATVTYEKIGVTLETVADDQPGAAA